MIARSPVRLPAVPLPSINPGQVVHTPASLPSSIGNSSMGEVWPIARITELCLQLTAGSGPANGDEHRALGSQSCETALLTRLCVIYLIYLLPVIIKNVTSSCPFKDNSTNRREQTISISSLVTYCTTQKSDKFVLLIIDLNLAQSVNCGLILFF